MSSGHLPYLMLGPSGDLMKQQQAGVATFPSNELLYLWPVIRARVGCVLIKTDAGPKFKAVNSTLSVAAVNRIHRPLPAG